MTYARIMTCSLCQLDCLCMQVHQKVSTKIERIETELVSSLPLNPPAAEMLDLDTHHEAQAAALKTSITCVQCFNVALEQPLSEEQATTLTW